MKRLIYPIITTIMVTMLALPALAKVTLDDVYAADAPKRARDLANNAAHMARHSSPLRPNIGNSSSSVVSKSGTCQAAKWSTKVCTLADTSYSCSMSGANSIGDREHGEIFRDGTYWKMRASRGEWGGVFHWTCTKPG
ncbi:hypothetical protein A165_01370 [Vibrio tasmaniensis ZS-17]|nr:hypothetical protein A165_01370 [Vibrio tasmaniensis ZS-17]PMM26334.1 hypothetical protein BCT58_08290 [Vibrio lentus]